MARIAVAFVLIISIILVYNTLPSNATISPDNTTATVSFANTSSVDNTPTETLEQANATANATIAAAQAEANATIAAAQAEANATIAAAQAEAKEATALAQANETIAAAERRANATQAAVQRVFTDLPNSIALGLFSAIVLVIAVPVFTDLFWAHYRRYKQKTVERPLGMPGLYRSVMAFGLIAIISILVVYLVALVSFYITVQSDAADALINVLQNLAAIIGTALATVIAFYFGSRGAENITDKALIAAGVRLPGTAGQGDQAGPPKITGRYPERDQSNIGVSTQIVSIFNKKMNSATITKNTFTLKKEGSNVNVEVEDVRLENNVTAVLQPIGDLDKGTKYVVTIMKDVEDQAGNKMDSDETWSFTTRTA